MYLINHKITIIKLRIIKIASNFYLINNLYSYNNPIVPVNLEKEEPKQVQNKPVVTLKNENSSFTSGEISNLNSKKKVVSKYVEVTTKIIYTYEDGSWKVWHSDSSIPSDLENIEAGRGYVFIMNSV